jgi:heme exporter protein B
MREGTAVERAIGVEVRSSLGRQVIAVIAKEVRSELRQRRGFALVLLSVGIVVGILAFALGEQLLSGEMAGAVLWVVFFFGLTPALSRSFVAEEERGTRLLLHLMSSPAAIYWGKLTYNGATGVLTNAVGCAAVLLVLPVPAVVNPGGLCVLVVLAALGFATVLTLLSAVVAVAHHRGVLLPILGFPLLVPVVLPGVEAARMVFVQAGWQGIVPLFQLMLAYAGSLAVVGFWLFEWVWQE